MTLSQLDKLQQDAASVNQERKPKDVVLYYVVLAVLKFGIRVKVPSKAMMPVGDISLEKLRERWLEHQRKTENIINQLPPEKHVMPVFLHKVVGPMNLVHAIRLGNIHFDSHMKKIVV